MGVKMNSCPVCADSGIEKKVGNETFEYKGQTLNVPDYVYYECPKCGESFVAADDNEHADKALTDFHRKVDGLLTPSEIKSIRQGFGYSQRDFAELLGVGTVTFSRYETGMVAQGKAMDRLLRVLRDMPQALHVFAPKAVIPEHLLDGGKTTTAKGA